MFIKVCDDFIQMMRELVKRDVVYPIEQGTSSTTEVVIALEKF